MYWTARKHAAGSLRRLDVETVQYPQWGFSQKKIGLLSGHDSGAWP